MKTKSYRLSVRGTINLHNGHDSVTTTRDYPLPQYKEGAIQSEADLRQEKFAGPKWNKIEQAWITTITTERTAIVGEAP